MRKIILYGTTAVLSFTILLVIYAPASIALRLFGDDIAVTDLSIYLVSGTIWHGSAELQFRDFPTSALVWTLAPYSIVQDVVRLELRASGLGHELQGDAEVEGDLSRLKGLHGSVASEYVNQVGRPHGLQFSGELIISDVNVVADSNWFAEATGTVHWTGGRVLYSTQVGSQSINLPPLDGTLGLVEDELILSVSANDLPVLSCVMLPTGWVKLTFTARLLELANLPWPEGASADDIALIIEEKVL